MRAIANRLMYLETTVKARRGSAKIPALFKIVEKLRPQLATLMGNGGIHALLSRALLLANEKSDWLSQVRVNTGGLLEFQDSSVDILESSKSMEAGVLLTTQLLELLETFVGTQITMGLINEVWPSLSLEDKEEKCSK